MSGRGEEYGGHKGSTPINPTLNYRCKRRKRREKKRSPTVTEKVSVK